jgi:hypothetical protein
VPTAVKADIHSKWGLAAVAEETRVTSYGQVTSHGHSKILFVQQGTDRVLA